MGCDAHARQRLLARRFASPSPHVTHQLTSTVPRAIPCAYRSFNQLQDVRHPLQVSVKIMGFRRVSTRGRTSRRRIKTCSLALTASKRRLLKRRLSTRLFRAVSCRWRGLTSEALAARSPRALAVQATLAPQAKAGCGAAAPRSSSPLPPLTVRWLYRTFLCSEPRDVLCIMRKVLYERERSNAEMAEAEAACQGLGGDAEVSGCVSYFWLVQELRLWFRIRCGAPCRR
jgi:hypothetical protein